MSRLVLGFVLVAMVVPALARAAQPVLSSRDVSVAFQLNPAHNGVAADDSIRPPLVLKWSRNFPFGGSFPIIVGGRVFITGNGGNYHNYVSALNLRTGATIWGPVDIGGEGHWTSLAYDRGRLFVTDSSITTSIGSLLALSARDGSILWKDQGPGQDDSPVAVRGVVYTGPGLQAYSEATGQLLWSRTASFNNGWTGIPAVSGNSVYTAGVDDNIFAFSTSGNPLWSYEGPDQGITTLVPIVSAGQVLSRDPEHGFNISDPGWIHSTSTGAQVGTFSSLADPAVTTSELITNPNLNVPNQLYYGLRAISRTSGQALWTFAGDDEIETAPLVANGTVYAGSWGQHLYALNGTTGRLSWSKALTVAVAPSNETEKTGPLSGLGIGGGYLVAETDLNGTSTGPTLSAWGPAAAAGSLSADSVNYGSIQVGQSSPTASVQVTDTGAAPLGIKSTTVAGPDSREFTLQGCTGQTLAPGKSCTLTIGFAPTLTGLQQANVDVSATDPMSHTIALQGVGSS